MNRRYRLTSATDFKRVRRTGKSYAHPLVILVASPSGLSVSRFGVTAGKTVGSAVQRNRAKRVLREALRSHILFTDSGWDVVIIARPAMLTAEWPEVKKAVKSLMKRAGMIEKTP